jgi:hypothetical protein
MKTPPDPLEHWLPQLKTSAPPDFSERVLQALPPPRRARRWWPEGSAWLAPALVGAAAMLLLFLAFPRPNVPRRSLVRFEVHAADATEVQLVGSFTQWETGRIQLRGPDASGHWSVELELPEGRYEYGFLVDGGQWLPDPNAEVRRDDGFGRLNAVLEI